MHRGGERQREKESEREIKYDMIYGKKKKHHLPDKQEKRQVWMLAEGNATSGGATVWNQFFIAPGGHAGNVDVCKSHW